MRKNNVENKVWINKCYLDPAPGKLTIIVWFAEFKCDRTNIDDAQRAGRPKEMVTPENIKSTKSFYKIVK